MLRINEAIEPYNYWCETEYNVEEKEFAEDSEMAIIPQEHSLENALLSLQDEEWTPFFANMLNLHGVNKAFNKDLKTRYISPLQQETELEMGLYGKNLILEGLKLLDEESELIKKLKLIKAIKEINNIDEAESDRIVKYISELKADLEKKNIDIQKSKNFISNTRWFDTGSQKLRDMAIEHFENPSDKLNNELKSSLETTFLVKCLNDFLDMEIIRDELEVKLSQLNEKFGPLPDEHLINHRLRNIPNNIRKLRLHRNSEKTIYRIFGSKEKFHALKVLDLSSVENPYRVTISALSPGESVMRGKICWLDRVYPFIAVSYNQPKFGSGVTRIGVLQEDSSYDKWRFEGELGFSLLSKYGNLENIMHENYRQKADLEKALNQLLTTGSCDVDPTDSTAGQYKLEPQL